MVFIISRKTRWGEGGSKICPGGGGGGGGGGGVWWSNGNL